MKVRREENPRPPKERRPRKPPKVYDLVPLIDRLLRRVVIDEPTGCWLWMGGRDEGGYGVIGLPRTGQNKKTHRVCYEHFVGPIPPGMELDHLCENPPCCHPDHLDPVTPDEHQIRTMLRDDPDLALEVVGPRRTPRGALFRQDVQTRFKGA